MNRIEQNYRAQAGFTMVELMVGATLGLLILAGAISMFISNKRVYTEQEELARLQENARFAIHMLVGDIRMAGHTGCSNDVASVENRLNGYNDDDDLFFFAPLEGAEGNANWQPSGSSDQVSSMIAGSDAITIRYLAPTDIEVMNPAQDVGNSQIFVSSNGDLEQGDAVALGDCASTDIVSISAAPTTGGCSGGADSTDPDDTCRTTITHLTTGPQTPGNWTPNLSRLYDSSAEFMRYVTNRYYVGTDPNGNPALFRQSGFGQVDQVIDGVENLQILYGEDTTNSDGVADVYSKADGVVDWNDVVSVRVAMLLRSVDEYGSDVDTSSYSLLGETIDPPDDRRRRRVFTSTVDIRNRSL